MIRKNRALAMILAGILAFVLLFSVFYIAFEADHDCIGDDCAICAVLSVCESVLHRLMGVGIAAVVVLIARRPRLLAARRSVCVESFVTPVSLKVKLSD